MEYLALFNNFDEFDVFFDEKNFEFPCVAYVQDENYVHYFKDYEALPTNLIVGESYPKVAAFFRKIMEELNLDFTTKEYYSIDLSWGGGLSNEINVTGYEWYGYLLNLQKGNISSETGEYYGSPVQWIKLHENWIDFSCYGLDLTTNEFYDYPV